MKTILRNSLFLALIGGLLLNPASAQAPVVADVEIPTPAPAGIGPDIDTKVATEQVKTTVDAAAETVEFNAERTDSAGYLRALSKEAGTDGRVDGTDKVSDAAGNTRVSRIRGIVADALDGSREQLAPVQASRASNLAEPAPSTRRQELRDAVKSATQATGNDGDRYISILQDEGDGTVVIDEETSRRPAVSRSAEMPDPLAAATEPPAVGVETYQVRGGDSLWIIAERLYGDGHRYLTLYEANKDRIADKNLLVIGQLLRIP